MTEEKEKDRIFLVCRTKSCTLAIRKKMRCTILMPSIFGVGDDGTSYADDLNRRKFCTHYTNETILKHNAPNWAVSPEKPGRRKRMEKVKPDISKVPARVLEF